MGNLPSEKMGVCYCPNGPCATLRYKDKGWLPASAWQNGSRGPQAASKPHFGHLSPNLERRHEPSWTVRQNWFSRSVSGSPPGSAAQQTDSAVGQSASTAG